jgi:photosystem II stability/assembly factor-like uncharacterized protein
MRMRRAGRREGGFLRVQSPWRLGATLTVAAALGAAAVAPAMAVAAPSFGPIVVVNPSDFGGEPGIDVDSTGYLYENAPSGGGPSWVYRSGDDGASWTRDPGPAFPTGGFDSNGAIDACDTYYMSDLYIGNATVHSTKDKGQTWLSQPISLAVPAGDRQWIETGPGCGTLYIDWEQIPTGIWIGKSTDGGVTFPLQKNISSPTDIIGNLAVDKSNGNVYAAYAQGGYKLAVSRDGGNNWTTKTVYAAPSDVTLADSFPVVTVDKAGNVYAVWEQATREGRGRDMTRRFDIVYSFSTNGGESWSTPSVIQDGSSGSNVFPWAVAGGDGRLDVVWYRADSGDGDPNKNQGPWYVDFAQSLSATGAGGFTKVRATPVSIHNDVICTEGTNCSGDSRDLLDFFEVAAKPDGLAVIAFTLDTTDVAAGSGNGDPRNAFVKQTSGDVLSGGGSPGPSGSGGACRIGVRGSGGRDVIRGTTAGESIRGFRGNDVIFGGRGDDCLFGYSGNDRLSGGPGNDRLYGGRGRDKLTGGRGNDRLVGGPGGDRIRGGPGRNRYSGGAGDDRIYSANRRRETVRCGKGTDFVRADRVDRLIGCEHTG